MNAATKFYDIGMDADDSTQWHLCQPTDENGTEVVAGRFRLAKQWDNAVRLKTRICNPGHAVSFSLGGHSEYFVTKILMDSLINALPLGALQAVPVEIEGVETQYEILNALDIVDCVDESRTKFSKFPRWTEEDGRPEKVGDYRINVLHIDATKATGHDLFRVKGWRIALVCSEHIRDLLISQGVTGIRFTLVS